ncbi:FecR family protein [Ulvibacterium sp.]|uniref:FecR family protein n=1 Tax=Ulvibacterium sp. TaxID=2665914 RepID=UPI003BAD3B50
MENERKVQELLLKFIREECTHEEIEEVLAYVKSNKGIEGMPSFEDVLSLMNEVPEMEYGKAQSIFSTILKQGKRRSRTGIGKRTIRYASVAALFIGVLSLGYFYERGTFDTSPENILIPANEAITLQLEDGTIEIIDPDGNKEVRDSKGNLVANQEHSQLNYSNAKDVKELVYNTLTVPYGKRFDVVLSDGTTVFMNSGTELKYPVVFLEKGNREVFVQGEAYFDVTSNNGRPFVVNAEGLNVEVLGTEFNVMAYPEDGMTDVILVEGSVGLTIEDTAQENVVLSPGEKGILDKNANTIATQKVNTNIYTAWRTGELVFRRMPFENLIKKLERHFNVSIVIENEALKQEVFSASFNNETIEAVLGFLNESYNIDYTIAENIIYIQ